MPREVAACAELDKHPIMHNCIGYENRMCGPSPYTDEGWETTLNCAAWNALRSCCFQMRRIAALALISGFLVLPSPVILRQEIIRTLTSWFGKSFFAISRNPSRVHPMYVPARMHHGLLVSRGGHTDHKRRSEKPSSN